MADLGTSQMLATIATTATTIVFTEVSFMVITTIEPMVFIATFIARTIKLFGQEVVIRTYWHEVIGVLIGWGLHTGHCAIRASMRNES